MTDHDPPHDPPHDPHDLPEDWPNVDDDPIAWVLYGLDILDRQIKCMIDHMKENERTDEKRDAYSAMIHCGAVMEGLQTIAAVMWSGVLTEEEKVEIARVTIERMEGTPMKAEVFEVDGRPFVKFAPEKVVIPDSLEGME